MKKFEKDTWKEMQARGQLGAFFNNFYSDFFLVFFINLSSQIGTRGLDVGEVVGGTVKFMPIVIIISIFLAWVRWPILKHKFGTENI